MAIISKARTRNAKPSAGRKSDKAAAQKKTKFLMVTFGQDDADIAVEFEEMAKSMRLSQAALGREMIRKCLGRPSHLP